MEKRKRVERLKVKSSCLCQRVHTGADWPAGRILLSRAKGQNSSSLWHRSYHRHPLLSTSLPVCLPACLPLLFYSFYCSSIPASIIMFRSAVVRSLRSSMPRVPRTPASFQLRSSPVARRSQFTPAFSYQAVRLYSAPAGLQKNEVEGRIVNLLKNFDKVRLQDRKPQKDTNWLTLAGLRSEQGQFFWTSQGKLKDGY